MSTDQPPRRPEEEPSDALSSAEPTSDPTAAPRSSEGTLPPPPVPPVSTAPGFGGGAAPQPSPPSYSTPAPSYPAPAPPYGAAPPPPPGGPLSGPSGAYSPTDALSYGWKKFTENLATILVAVLIYIVVIGVVGFVWSLVTGGIFSASTRVDPQSGVVTTSGGGVFASLASGALIGLVVFVLVSIMQAGIIRGALKLADGKKVQLADLFSTAQLGPVLVTAILVGIATSIGSLLCYLPGIAVGFLTQFAMFYVVDKNMGAVDAIKASFQFVMANLGPIIVFYLLSIVAYIVGSIPCGIGLLVAVPVVILGQCYTYRRLQNEPVAA